MITEIDCKLCKRYNDATECCFDYPMIEIKIARELCALDDTQASLVAMLSDSKSL